MIKQLIFTVAGNTDVDDDIIFCNRLVFTGIHPQLVIRPKKGAKPGAQRLLKIVADHIDTQLATDPEITYNLAEDWLNPAHPADSFELPVGDAGLDPETQAKTGDDGIPSYFQGGIPPLDPALLLPASPNYDPVLDALNFGAYPKADDGGNGVSGGRGGKGVKGFNAPILEIWTTEIVGNNLKLDLMGQQGGVGGIGGNGQNGGNGQKGSLAVVGTDSNWLGVPSVICVQQSGMGGNGGRGGDAGCGGDGGDGGNGGVVRVFHTSSVNLTKLTPVVNKGKGGKAGPPGIPGHGGKGGPKGDSLAQCATGLASYNGPDGMACRGGEGERKGIAQDGDDGLDGSYTHYQITDIPKLPLF